MHPREGIEFDWLMVDSQDQVAMLSTAGYGPVPRWLGPYEDTMDDAMDQVIALAETGEALGNAERVSGGDYSDWLALSRRGLFTYDWTHRYERLTIPSTPILVSALPPISRRMAELTRIAGTFQDLPYLSESTFCRASGRADSI
ncbi:hypothetical protein [Kineosporia babensis]|uniref:Uncharacterized protein n=1 Tax=Kineosporia babensis TaxID=499548 RepID=A0A9X1NH82_9ACTN|nr:hypothetical protein [Kineosporia babensis]MCD5315007.1 hypothetical protein [Kineosporia babensis]